MPKLYLIDGANYLFRAFYAIRNLSNSRGLPTGALYGFSQMLLKLMREEKPDLVAVCFDTEEPTFRDELYEDYKANRKETPDDLVQQFPYVKPIVEVLGFPIVEKAGFEADDIIGTLAKRYAAKGFEVVIVSGDKDLMQLIAPGISILDEMKGLRVGPKEVRDKFGVGPEGVVEILGLAGDASDNIPGVPGVGPKTAQVLIQKYGTVEEVIAHAGELKGALAERIKKNAASARLSRKLAEIDTDVDVATSEETLKRKPMDSNRVRELFGELGFMKLIQALAPSRAVRSAGYRALVDLADIRRAVAAIREAKKFSIYATAHEGDPMRADIAGFALAWGDGEVAYIPLSSAGLMKGANAELFAAHSPHDGAFTALDVVAVIGPLMAEQSVALCGHGLNRELTLMRRLGLNPAKVAFDTMLASYLIDSSRDNGLDGLAQRYLARTLQGADELAGKGRARKDIADMDAKAVANFACERAEAAFKLAGVLAPKIDEAGLRELFEQMEMPLLRVLVDMQSAGVKIDSKKLSLLSGEFRKRLDVLQGKIHSLAKEEFNINSPQQLGEILFGKLKLPGARKTKTGFSTSQDILEELASEHELARLVLDYRSLSKLKGTYIDALPELINPKTGRIHTSFNQAVTATGRLSSSDPNLQNIPVRSEDGRKIREAFIAEDGFLLISADYSQIELRVLAHMSRDETLLEAFRRGDDVHAVTAAGIFGGKAEDVTVQQRAAGKTVNFATIYGQSAFGLSKQLGIEVGEAADYIEGYFKRYPGVAKYREEILKAARRDGFVKTLFGRRRPVPDVTSSNAQMAQFSERIAFNTVFQGTAADIIKRAMITIHDGLAAISKSSRMILQVHDELLFEVPSKDSEKVKAYVTQEMESAAQMDVPLTVDAGVGANWALAH